MSLGLPLSSKFVDPKTGQAAPDVKGWLQRVDNALILTGPVTDGHIIVSDGGNGAGDGGPVPVGGITQLTGDGTAGPGSGSQALTLATVNGNVGTFGDSTHVAQVTANAKGLITALANVAIAAPSVMAILTVDPSPLVNDTAWWFRDGATPETVSVKVRIGGVTTTFPIGETT